MTDLMVRTIFVTFQRTPARLGVVNLDIDTVDFNDGDSYPLSFIMSDPNVTSIQFTSR